MPPGTPGLPRKRSIGPDWQLLGATLLARAGRCRAAASVTRPRSGKGPTMSFASRCGAWGTTPVRTRPSASSIRPRRRGRRLARSGGDPAYPDLCIPPPPPDLDGRYVYDRGFRHITVLPSDPHNLDGNHDVAACEGGGLERRVPIKLHDLLKSWALVHHVANSRAC